MNARTEGFEVSLQLRRREQDINAHVSPTPFSTADVQVIDRLQMVAFSILAKLVCEALWGQWVFCVVLTPPLIRCIQIFGAGFIIGLECHITLRIEKVQNVIGIPNSGRDIVPGSLADGEVVVIGDQPPQSFQHPEEDSLFFGNQFLSKERIIEPIRRLVLGGQNDLATKETIAAVMKCRQCSVAEAEEAYIKQPLIALFSLPFQIHPQFCCHNGFYIVGFGQGVHVQIIVQHEQLALQVGSGETTVLYFLNGSGVHVEPENGVHHHTDPAFALAALADQHEHFLSFGGWNQAVAQILLQGGNILRFQQF